eukprot:TRINITY_DN20629_c0_g1_i1.p1 TRINITY_DN20629_c0_g1~~TRINITY_DN20629_c0_g1_i1.p1  ORF type:complete len:176 (-),score=34.90 TRINITY_DN20629_c0_g1_i1:366-893(-)
MGATRRHRNQALNQAKLDKLNEAADEQQRQLDPEGMSRARDKIHTFTRRTDDLTANWARFLVFSSGFLAVVICSSLVSRTDMSFKALLSAKLAVLTSICSGSYAHGFRRDEAKVCAILLLAVQAGVHFIGHLHGDWMFVAGFHFLLVWWGIAFCRGLNQKNAKTEKHIEKMMYGQ